MTVVAAVGAMALAALPMVALADFTVDDALVPARYALSLARGEGYHPSVGATPSDGVTPLGFAHLLVPFAASGVLGAHRAAQLLGAFAWALAAGGLGTVTASLGGSRLRFGALALLATSAPMAGWAVAGLETGLVAAMVGLGLVLRERGRGPAGALAIGLAAGWRPELLPVATWLAFAAGPGEAASASAERERAPARRATRVALAIAPAVAVAAVRFLAFDRAAPLSVHAKLPVLSVGLPYAVVAALLAGLTAPLAPLALRRADSWTRNLVASLALHVASMTIAGGDWMPLARLAVPLVPVAVLASSRLLALPRGRLPPGVIALVVALGVSTFGFVRAWPAVHAVGSGRRALIEEMRPVLADAQTIASIDVGWLGAAAEHARIVDLAGITDPTVAALPFGHTSRRLPRAIFDERRVDAVILLLAKREDRAGTVPWNQLAFARATEAWIATMPGIEEAFELTFASETPLRYVVLRRRRGSAP